MPIRTIDFEEAFDFIEPAVKAILNSSHKHDGFHILAFRPGSGPIAIAEKAFGAAGKPGRTYRLMCNLKAGTVAQHQMSIEELRIINPGLLEGLHIHDGSVLDLVNGFGIVSAGVGNVGNIALTTMAETRVYESARRRVPEAHAAE